MKYIILFIISFNLFAADSFDVPEFSVELKGTNAKEKIEYAMKYPEGVLNRYNPVGGSVKNKKVEGSKVSFTMTKKVLIITKTFDVTFVLDITPSENNCKENELAYLYTLNLDGSDALVIDNIDRLEFNICLKELNSDKFNARVFGKIFKGKHYSEPVGSVAKNTINDQVIPFVEAIKAEIAK